MTFLNKFYKQIGVSLTSTQGELIKAYSATQSEESNLDQWDPAMQSTNGMYGADDEYEAEDEVAVTAPKVTIMKYGAQQQQHRATVHEDDTWRTDSVADGIHHPKQCKLYFITYHHHHHHHHQHHQHHHQHPHHHHHHHLL